MSSRLMSTVPRGGVQGAGRRSGTCRGAEAERRESALHARRHPIAASGPSCMRSPPLRRYPAQPAAASGRPVASGTGGRATASRCKQQPRARAAPRRAPRRVPLSAAPTVMVPKFMTEKSTLGGAMASQLPEQLYCQRDKIVLLREKAISSDALDHHYTRPTARETAAEPRGAVCVCRGGDSSDIGARDGGRSAAARGCRLQGGARGARGRRRRGRHAAVEGCGAGHAAGRARRGRRRCAAWVRRAVIFRGCGGRRLARVEACAGWGAPLRVRRRAGVRTGALCRAPLRALPPRACLHHTLFHRCAHPGCRAPRVSDASALGSSGCLLGSFQESRREADSQPPPPPAATLPPRRHTPQPASRWPRRQTWTRHRRTRACCRWPTAPRSPARRA